ncbi:uncharacterized protein LOC128388190 [Panonychus citri]|uniref:uncharacterized protein LOC128388190 n=1 Tax=Panonychus citri TaxID=50023 RepID=UPI00230700F9|nr:uncharacterized protein LOC128388190 [Panonychus citri]
MVKPKKRSPTWSYFGTVHDHYGKEINPDHYFCELCFERELSACSTLEKVTRYKSTTAISNMSTHLATVHRIQAVMESRNTFNTAVFAGCRMGFKERKLHLTNDISLWFSLDLLPFQKVEGKGFKRFLIKNKIVKDERDIPSCRTISQHGLPRVFNLVRSCVKPLIRKKNVALAMDLWTDSLRRMKYLGVTIHFIKSLETVHLNLGTVAFPESHTAINIYNKLKKLCEEYKVDIESAYIVRDCGANVVAACRINNGKSHSCIGHGIHNLITVDGFKKVPDLLNIFTKMKEIHSALRFKNADVAAYNESVVPASPNDFLNLEDEVLEENREESLQPDEDDIFPMNFDEIGDEIEISSTDFVHSSTNPRSQNSTLKVFCPTRWHSLLTMTDSMIRNQSAINHLLGEIDRFELILSKKDLNLMTALVKFLAEFKSSVDLLCAEKVPTINKAAVLHCHLKAILMDQVDNDPHIVLCKKEMLKHFESRFPITELVIVAALLDPKFKNLDIINDYCFESFKTKHGLIKEYYNSMNFDDQDEDPITTDCETECDGVLTQLAKRFSSNPSESSAFDLEIDSYLRSKDASDVLEFWGRRKDAWPRLYKLATVLLAIPATSVPVERLFSIAGLTLNKKRCQLKPERLSKICFIHDNFDFVSKNCDKFDFN